ncbi:ROK family protein [Tessaracoccus sp. OH4464_COT-324]|uniref:ROK family protein n=1 Tax=Tessaracoccus sp. OH4464_COT-324 TaxID=2491059 RepID=UPI000F63DF3C|nr:ROK family protein [Tessaracoccus sp. OH4464_COT-324]RRD46930.1 ROK family protein [Tessaracoccus sp. OH4464_COT-324]
MQQAPQPIVARQAGLRSQNLALAASLVFASKRPVARVDVAKATGMTRSTASRLVDDLVAGGILIESDPIYSNKAGRPAVPLSPASRTYFGLGLEVNVSHLAARLIDLRGDLVAARDIAGDFVGSNPATVLAQVGDVALQCLAEIPAGGRLVGVQVAVPGLVDADTNHLLRAPNLRWGDVDVLRELAGNGLRAIAEAPSAVMNEADCAAILASREAPGRNADLDTFLYLSGEVGIGSALIIEGRLARGRRGWAGEIGHTCINPKGPRCSCGATGCLEQYAGTTALLRAAGARSAEELRTKLIDSDERALAALEAASQALSLAVANACNLLDVSTIILGGDLSTHADAYTPAILAELDQRLLTRPFTSPQVLSVLPDHAAPAMGAAFVAVERLIADPAHWVPEHQPSDG